MKPNTPRWAPVVAILASAVALIVGMRALRQPYVPKGQRRLLELDAANLEQVRGAFNAGAGHARVIAFLSPT